MRLPLHPLHLLQPTSWARASGAGASSSVRTLYVYGDQLRPMVEETDGVQMLNIYGPGGQIIAQVVRDGQGGEEVRYLLADHLGSTRVVLDGDGNVVARFEYGPHGETTTAGTAAAEVRYRYTGHPYDEAQGVYETPARGYDPTLGRFLSVDPQRQDASPYVYAGNNPVGFLDITGGAPRPFVVRSGRKSAKDNNYTTKTLAESLGGYESGLLQDATAVFGQPNQPKGGGKSQARTRPMRVLYGSDGGEELLYNDKMYWIIGDEEGTPKVPGDLKGGLEKLRKWQEDFARSIVLIDISSTGEAHLGISQALKGIPGGQHEVVIGRVISARKFIETSEYKTKGATGMIMKDQPYDQPRFYDLPRFQEYVETVAGRVDNLPLSKRVQPDTNLSQIPESLPHFADLMNYHLYGSGSYSGSELSGSVSHGSVPSLPPFSSLLSYSGPTGVTMDSSATPPTIPSAMGQFTPEY